VPLLTIRTDEGQERSVTAGQVLLKSALAEQAPQVGDRIFIQYSGIGEAKPGKAPPKQFKVAVQTGAGNVEPEAFSTQAARDKIQAATPGLTPTDDIPF